MNPPVFRKYARVACEVHKETLKLLEKIKKGELTIDAAIDNIQSKCIQASKKAKHQLFIKGQYYRLKENGRIVKYEGRHNGSLLFKMTRSNITLIWDEEQCLKKISN